jgi:hypothetical protein
MTQSAQAITRASCSITTAVPPLSTMREALAAEKSAEVDALAAEAARALGCENGLETAEAVLRAGLLRR